MKFLKFVLFIAISFFTFLNWNNVKAETQKSEVSTNPKDIYIAKVIDVSEVKDFSYVDQTNKQFVSLELVSSDKSGARIDTTLIFPNTQFKSPLRVGDRVLLGTDDISSNKNTRIISMYRQNNLLIWFLILVGLFILISGFKSNIKYFQIFIISLISGLIILFFYHKNTYITFLGLFAWLSLATVWFSAKTFRKRVPAIVLSLGVIGNGLLSMFIVFIMKNISIFDTGFFDLFSNSSVDARRVMIYIFALIVVYPITLVIGEQIISEAIKKKREENDILRIALIKHVSKTTLKTLNYIFLTFFGIFFGIFVAVIAISSSQGLRLQILNSSALSQVLSVGFLILFSLLIFVPFISLIAGVWLGKYESHELVTDQNLKQLELH